MRVSFANTRGEKEDRDGDVSYSMNVISENWKIFGA